MSDQSTPPPEAETGTKGQAGGQTNGQEAGQAGAETASGAKAAPPEERIAKLEAEVADLKDQVLRAAAEVENTRRRAQRDREDASKYAVASMARDLLAVADNLRRALEAVPTEGRERDEMLKSLIIGVEATERQLLGAFEHAGVKKIEAMGAAFDPNYHQVMFEIENTGKAAGTIVQVLQPGYTIRDRLLREAMVGVAKGPVVEA